MKRVLNLCGLVAAAALLLISPVSAQSEYPNKPIRLLVGFGAGSGSDLTARMIGTKLATLAQQSVVVENRPGAAGLLAAESIGQNNSDPYQLVYVTGSIVAAHLTHANRKVDVMKDLQPVIQAGDSQLLLLVNNRLPVQNYRELMDLFRKSPGKHNYGSTGVGGATHLFMEELLGTEDVKVVHVPYKGTGQALVALLAGEIDMMFATQSIAGEPIRGGKIKAFAISGDKRTSSLPDIPTFREAGNKKFNSTLISGFMTGAKVEPFIVNKLNRWINEILQQKDVQERLQSQDMTIKGGNPEQFRQALLDDLLKQKSILSKLELN